MLDGQGSESQVTTHSFRAYARHRGCAHGAVQQAYRRGRLKDSVVVVAGKPRIVDFGVADVEWERNTNHMKRSTFANGQEQGPAGLTLVDTDRLSVIRTGGHVVLCWLKSAGSNGDGPDPDNDPLFALTIGGASVLAKALEEKSRQTTDDLTGKPARPS